MTAEFFFLLVAPSFPSDQVATKLGKLQKQKQKMGSIICNQEKLPVMEYINNSDASRSRMVQLISKNIIGSRLTLQIISEQKPTIFLSLSNT
jgi:hypothetical protein